MTTEDRRLVAALTTEIAEQRRVILGLMAAIETLCDMFVKTPSKISAYAEAKGLLK